MTTKDGQSEAEIAFDAMMLDATYALGNLGTDTEEEA